MDALNGLAPPLRFSSTLEAAIKDVRPSTDAFDDVDGSRDRSAVLAVMVPYLETCGFKRTDYEVMGRAAASNIYSIRFLGAVGLAAPPAKVSLGSGRHPQTVTHAITAASAEFFFWRCRFVALSRKNVSKHPKKFILSQLNNEHYLIF